VRGAGGRGAGRAVSHRGRGLRSARRLTVLLVSHDDVIAVVQGIGQAEGGAIGAIVTLGGWFGRWNG